MSMRSIFSIIAWNIIEAIYVIHVASPPAPLSSTPIQPQTSRNRSLRSNPMRYSSSVRYSRSCDLVLRHD